MKQAIAVFATLLALVLGGRTWATEAVAPLAARLAGNTLSAVTFLPHKAGMPGGGELARVMLQAYLRPGGGALVRVWDPARDSYTVPIERSWTLAGTRLCIDSPYGWICADVHVWGPRIAGVSSHPYAMLDGDLTPGNKISATR
jgi:hypothetical protein